MAKNSPLLTVKERFGSKAKLVDAVAGVTEPFEGESADDHKRRLRNVSNAKLLHLVARGEQAAALGGRDGLVKTLLELSGQPKDHEYADALKRRSVGRLIDQHAGAVKRSKASRKAAAKPKPAKSSKPA